MRRVHAGTMKSLYMIRSILECVDRKLICDQAVVKLCILEPSAATVVLILSLMTSAASLGYKRARNACICCRCCPRPVARTAMMLQWR
jgi:hypothetical protein